MVYKYFSKTILLFVIAILLASCNNKKTEAVITTSIIQEKPHSFDDGMPMYLNSLNLPEMTIPFVGSFSAANSVDTLDIKMMTSEYLNDFRLFVRGEDKNALNITEASEVRFYDEGDLNGDGTHEIGILPGYNTSACRSYSVYSYKNHKWRLFYEISSHLGDRERGIDYVKREGDKIRILTADDGCCQCFGLDTIYEKIKNQ